MNMIDIMLGIKILSTIIVTSFIVGFFFEFGKDMFTSIKENYYWNKFFKIFGGK